MHLPTPETESFSPEALLYLYDTAETLRAVVSASLEIWENVGDLKVVGDVFLLRPNLRLRSMGRGVSSHSAPGPLARWPGLAWRSPAPHHATPRHATPGHARPRLQQGAEAEGAKVKQRYFAKRWRRLPELVSGRWA